MFKKYSARRRTQEKLHRMGINLIPAHESGKKPMVSWKKYQEQKLSDKNFQKYFIDESNNAMIVCGPSSGDITVIDFDSMTAFEKYKGKLHGLDKTLVVKTKRGVHVYYRVKGQRSRVFKNIKVDVKAAKALVMAPNSILGDVEYKVLNFPKEILRLQSLDIIKVFEEDNGNGLGPTKNKKKNREPVEKKRKLEEIDLKLLYPVYKLPRLHRKYLIENNPKLLGKDNRSDADMKVIVNLVGNGYTFSDLELTFSKLAHPESKFRTYQYGSGTTYLKSSYKNAKAHIEVNQSELQAALVRFLEYSLGNGALFTIWECAVLYAYVLKAVSLNRNRINYSQRDWAIEAGLSKEWLNKVVNTLVERKVLYQVKSVKKKNAYKYGIRYSLLNSASFSSPIINRQILRAFSPAHDIFRKKALGKLNWRIWAFTHVFSNATRDKIKRKLKVKKSCLKKSLNTLLEANLIKIQKGKKIISEIPDDFEDTAKTLGLFGAREKQRKEIEWERSLF